MATDFGQDVSTFPVLDMTGRTISGPRVVAECSLRRLTSDEGDLEYDPTFGYNLQKLLNEDLDARDLRRHQSRAANQLELDERIASANVTLTLDTSHFSLNVRITGELANGAPFEFVLSIDKVSSAILKVS